MSSNQNDDKTSPRWFRAAQSAYTFPLRCGMAPTPGKTGKTWFQTHIYRIWIINPYIVCIHPSRRRLCSAAVCTHNFFSLLPVWTGKSYFLWGVKWAYCDTSVFRRGLEMPSRWNARDVTHALPANTVPKNYSNWKWELQAEFNVFGCLFYWRTVQFKTSACMSAWFIFFAHKSGAKKRK